MRYCLCLLFLFLGIFIFALTGCQTSPVSDGETSSSKVERFMQNYYQHKNVTSITEHIIQLIHSDYVLQEKNTPHVAAFYAEIFATHQDSVFDWLSVIYEYPRDYRYPFLIALAWAKSPLCQRYAEALEESTDPQIAEFMTLIRSQKSPNYAAYPIPSQDALDATWYAFYATGNLNYFEAILFTALYPDDKGHFSLVALPALFSIREHCDRDPNLRRLKNTYQKKLPPEQREQLEEIFDSNLTVKEKN